MSIGDDSELEEYLEIKAEIFRIVRANSERRSGKVVLRKIKEHLPGVSQETINRCLGELLGDRL